ncbi:MAG: serine/threonine protein kinase [Armatimonadetes bacterium]|nr:serine/threonine protein kinase [Armatimonadota bacterium]
MSSRAGTLGKYQIIREIARSNDIVYEAYDPAMNRRVALKELAVPGGATDKQRQERLARFRREAKAAGSLAHPNIVTIYEVGEDHGRAYIAMEYLEGRTLRQQLDVDGSLGQDEAVRIVLEVLDGLAYAHEKGVVHRDIKPDNIQLLPDKRVKITDFGIARLMFEPSLTVDGQVFGTPSYMSPEQVVGRDVDARTDVWGCGVLMYEAISGNKPFSGDSVVAISHAIMHLEPVDPANASYAINQVLRRSLDKAPDQRYTNAKVMAQALRDAMESLQDATPASQPSTFAPALTAYPYSSASPPPAYGQPYGRAFGGQNQPPIPIPFPPGWTAPPPSRPLLSPATWQFIRRTMGVIIIGGSLVALGFFGMAELSKASESKAKIRNDLAQTQQVLDDAAVLRNQSISTVDLGARVMGLQEALRGFERAIELAPTPQARTLALQEAARTALMLAREFLAGGWLREADISAQEAIRYADGAGDTGMASNARALQDEIRFTIR